jgi:NADPH:quinone reductase-like Zn-dependent oxidoreductase
MKAARIHRFGPPDVIVVEELPRPAPGAGELVVRVVAAGVGPWDALIREGKSKVSPPPPLTLGSDLSGVVEGVGADVKEFSVGDEVYGVTNPQFCGAQAEYAVAFASMMAHKPSRLSHVEASSAPVVAVTAWQMLFEYARVVAGQTTAAGELELWNRRRGRRLRRLECREPQSEGRTKRGDRDASKRVGIRVQAAQC